MYRCHNIECLPLVMSPGRYSLENMHSPRKLFTREFRLLGYFAPVRYGSRSAKFAKVFSLESFPLYSILSGGHVHVETIFTSTPLIGAFIICTCMCTRGCSMYFHCLCSKCIVIIILSHTVCLSTCMTQRRYSHYYCVEYVLMC